MANVIKKLENSEYNGADLVRKKFSGAKISTVKLNDKDRLVLSEIKVNGNKYLILLEIILNHEYKNAKYLAHKNPLAFEKFLSKNIENIIKKIKTFENNKQINEQKIEVIKPQSDYLSISSYNNKIIILNHQQQLATISKWPMLISGAAGSGKSCVALELLKKLSVNKNQKYLYITSSPKLVTQMIDIWLKNNINSHQVNFLSYKDFICQHNPSLDKVTSASKHDFIDWFNKSHKHKVLRTQPKNQSALDGTIIFKTPEKLYQEFRIASGYDKDFYLKKPYQKNQSLFELKFHQEIWQAKVNYEIYLKKQNKVDFKLLQPKVSAQYDYIIVDESQDLSLSQMKSIQSSVNNKDNICLLMDTHQSLYDTVSPIKIIQQYFENLTQFILPGSFRYPKYIANLVNRIINLKSRLYNGVADNVQCQEVKVETNEAVGELKVLTEHNIEPIIDACHADASYAVVCHPKDKDIALKLFKTGQVFTAEEIKGLEFKNVILFNPFNDDAYKTINHLIKNNHNDKINNNISKSRIKDIESSIACNKLIISLTRTTKNLFIYQKDETHNISHLLNYLNLSFNQPILKPVIKKTSKINSNEKKNTAQQNKNWLVNVNELVVENESQAKEILMRNLHYTNENADLYIKKRLKQIQINTQRNKHKLKRQLKFIECDNEVKSEHIFTSSKKNIRKKTSPKTKRSLKSLPSHSKLKKMNPARLIGQLKLENNYNNTAKILNIIYNKIKGSKRSLYGFLNPGILNQLLFLASKNQLQNGAFESYHNLLVLLVTSIEIDTLMALEENNLNYMIVKQMLNSPKHKKLALLSLTMNLNNPENINEIIKPDILQDIINIYSSETESFENKALAIKVLLLVLSQSQSSSILLKVRLEDYLFKNNYLPPLVQLINSKCFNSKLKMGILSILDCYVLGKIKTEFHFQLYFFRSFLLLNGLNGKYSDEYQNMLRVLTKLINNKPNINLLLTTPIYSESIPGLVDLLTNDYIPRALKKQAFLLICSMQKQLPDSLNLFRNANLISALIIFNNDESANFKHLTKVLNMPKLKPNRDKIIKEQVKSTKPLCIKNIMTALIKADYQTAQTELITLEKTLKGNYSKSKHFINNSGMNCLIFALNKKPLNNVNIIKIIQAISEYDANLKSLSYKNAIYFLNHDSFILKSMAILALNTYLFNNNDQTNILNELERINKHNSLNDSQKKLPQAYTNPLKNIFTLLIDCYQRNQDKTKKLYIEVKTANIQLLNLFVYYDVKFCEILLDSKNIIQNIIQNIGSKNDLLTSISLIMLNDIVDSSVENANKLKSVQTLKQLKQINNKLKLRIKRSKFIDTIKQGHSKGQGHSKDIKELIEILEERPELVPPNKTNNLSLRIQPLMNAGNNNYNRFFEPSNANETTADNYGLIKRDQNGELQEMKK